MVILTSEGISSEMGTRRQDSEISTGLSSHEIHRIKSNSIISDDLETAIQKAGFGRFNYFMLLLAIPAAGTVTFVTGSMPYVIPVAGPDLDLTPTSKALLQSAPFAGMICSGFLWGVLSDSFGRKRLLVAGFLLDFVMNTLCGLIRHLPTMLLFKFLSGFMICGPFSIFTAYISEVFMAKGRDMVVLSTGVFCSILQILHVCLALLLIPTKPPDWLPLKSWQLFILCSGVPALISGVACAFGVESPKFLAEKGKSEKALVVCQRIYSINTGLSPDSFPVKKIRVNDKFSGTQRKVSGFRKLLDVTAVFRPPYVYRLLMVVIVQLCIAATMNLVRLWLPEMLTLMSNADSATGNHTITLCPLLIAGRNAQTTSSQVISSNKVYYDMIAVNAGGLLSQIIFLGLTKYNKKKIIIMILASISMSCALIIPSISSDFVFIPASIFISVLSAAFNSQIGLVVEIFPTSVRATSLSIMMMVGRIGILVANFAVANLMFSYCEHMFYGIALCCASVIIICAFLPTKPMSDT